MTTYTDTIGAGGGFDTLALWYGTSASVPVSGDVLVAELLGQDHNFAGNYTGWNAVDFSIKIKAHASATHGGDWNTGARLLLASGNSQSNWVWGDHSIDLAIEDIVISSVGTSFFKWEHKASSGVGGSYHSNVNFDRCLITTYNQSPSFFAVSYLSLFDGPDTAPTSLGTSKWAFNNCVYEGDGSTQFIFRSSTGVTHPIVRTETEVVGCFLFRPKRMSAGYSNSQSASNFTVKGCIHEPFNNPVASRLTDNITNFSSVVVDYITGEYDSDLGSTSFFNWGYRNGTPTNVTTNSVNTVFPGFNYDDTVTSGEVCFVGPSGPEGNYRLVADLDNLAVKYMTSDELSYKDITGYKRPGGTDQRDAGAYQSISDQVLINNIGTSSVDFTPDYATAILWDSTYYDNANVLNGETHVLRLKSGEGHSLGNLQVTMDGQANVNQSFILSGHEPHNGVWEEGAILDDQSGFSPDTGANNFSVKFKDIVVSGTTSGAVTTRPLTQRLGSTTYEQGNAATEHTFEFENCLVRYISTVAFGSNLSPQLNYGNNKGYITDDDGNIIERGVTHHIFKNCVVIHPYPTSAYFGGFVILGGEFASTNVSATFLAEGCTFINSQVRPFRYLDRFQFSAIGCITYNEPSAHSRFTTEGGHSFFIDGGTSRDPDDFIIKDCIFNRGAGNVLLTQNTSDDRLTFWVAEPLASEYANDPSVNLNSASVSANVNNYYWPRVNATNMSIRVPFVFGEKADSGEVSLRPKSLSSIEPFQQGEGSLGIDYAVNSDMPLYDIAGVLRGSDPNAGAYEGFFKFVTRTLVAFGNTYIRVY